jgi:hypothetical protein
MWPLKEKSRWMGWTFLLRGKKIIPFYRLLLLIACISSSWCQFIVEGPQKRSEHYYPEHVKPLSRLPNSSFEKQVTLHKKNTENYYRGQNEVSERKGNWRMGSSGMLQCVAFIRTDVSEELSASTFRVIRICELGIRHSHRRENLKSYESWTVHEIICI